MSAPLEKGMIASENLVDAVEMSQEIEKLLVLKRELKAGIWQTELGNFQKHFDEHPLLHEIHARITQLRVAITEVI